MIFTSLRTAVEEGYAQTAERMLQLAGEQPGFLGVESAREEVGITVSYWESPEAIRAWKDHAEHVLAREKGRRIVWLKTMDTSPATAFYEKLGFRTCAQTRRGGASMVVLTRMRGTPLSDPAARRRPPRAARC